MDSKKAVEILQKKMDENKKAHEDLEKANDSIDLEGIAEICENYFSGVVQMCENHFRGLKDSKEDDLFKHHYVYNYWFEDDKFFGHDLLKRMIRGMLDNLCREIYIEIMSDCQFIESQMKEMINAINDGKDIKSFFLKEYLRK